MLPGATVTIKNEATSATAMAVTDANGAFLITNVIAGRYSLTVAEAGDASTRGSGVHEGRTRL